MPSTFSAVKNTICPQKSDFTVDHIPDLTGQVAVVTGGNTGLGKETVKALLQHGAKVYMASRNKERASAAIQDLKELTGKEAIFLQIELTSLASVKRAATEFLSKEDKLHMLFNNAGVMWADVALVSEDGYDWQFAANALGHFLFTELLTPALIAGHSTAPNGRCRVVNTSSLSAMNLTMKWDTLKDGPARKKTSSDDLYSQSKFINVVHALEIERRYGARGVAAFSVNPGLLKTDMQRDFNPVLRAVLYTFFQDASQGALTQLWAGTMEEPLAHSGAFCTPIAKIGECRKEAYDPEIGKMLWEFCLDAVKNFL
ncbi:hypothetical protein EIP91_004550 [Steccherinum ochraceum]|uniref:NAD(P)-binding protein n=1 Tax=Steccherinum ochraceum TaxID=92696 RepID=A0A4R0RJW9_9APHY|nr:hypothetical protein EIP91_004550 [Steccherinum ochraceum]